MNTPELNKPLQNRKYRTETGQTKWADKSTESNSESECDGSVRKPKLPKTHQGYWVSRLQKRTYKERDGRITEIPTWQIRMFHKSREAWFNLDTTNQTAASTKARDLYLFLRANDWDATMAKFKPEAQVVAKANVTVGEYCVAVRVLNRLRLRTFLNYENCLKTIVSEIFDIKPEKGSSKFDYRSSNPGRVAWVAKIESRRLEELTVERLTAWKRSRVGSAGSSPVAIASARRTVNTYIRCARSLFSAPILKELSAKLALPTPVPFAGVELEESGSMKYRSTIQPQALIAAARDELKRSDPQAYLAFLLGLFVGLRKGEIDLLEWRMIDWINGLIRLEETEWLHLKTQDSAAEIAIDPEVVAELRALLPAPGEDRGGWPQFVLRSERPPRPESPRPYYRCEDSFERLNAWLRGKGVKANKPLHELRKELGAMIASTSGIYAASRFLRHSDISTTSRHYADSKARITTGLGGFLRNAEAKEVV